MENGIKDGDVYFENEVLKLTYRVKPTPFKNDKNVVYISMDMDFLGHKSGFSPAIKENADEYIKKRMGAYDLIPKGCKIIPKHCESLLQGLLIGGILEDSIEIVYGLGERGGIRGFSCSVYFLPSKEKLRELGDYSSLSGEFSTK